MKFKVKVSNMNKLSDKQKEKLAFLKDSEGNFFYVFEPEYKYPHVQINSLEELLYFTKKFGKIILFPEKEEGEPTIEIYNGYRE